jgi:putative glutamine amidotransferase
VRPRPVIGIATQTQEAVPGELPACWVMGQRYVRVLTAAGAVPWLIPLLPDDAATLRGTYDRLDGVFLTGGVDVEPARYGEERHPLCGRNDPARDATEIQLVRWAVADHKPLLGVCRGVQVLNVAAGGTLYQDVAAQRPGALKHDHFPTREGGRRDFLAHPVRVAAGSHLARILGVGEAPVNSMHHQGIKDLAPPLAATAFAPDGLVEGVEGGNGHFLLGVQWHPEELADASAAMRRLFTAFVEAARDFSPAAGLR